ncbi:glycosyl transferase [Amycolatopsis sp. WAC 01376]|uniref:glycosyltransferase n=1 Tax=Amycolatopsis sp. WAC 01376 TaxID=2203195 RepID=UPI000F7A1143|nr:glycosyltransferase [Amycolatopsis sp. WAC 01376]RSM55261.1 glycosyl transferase [Amycolatopsis sp. WAC 01376]
MRVLFSGNGTRGDVEPLVALALRLRERGADVRMCAPPDYVERMAEVGIPLTRIGPPVRAGARGGGPAPGAPELADATIAEQFDRIPAVAEGCDAVVATGLVSAAVGVRSVAEKLGIPYFYTFYCPNYLPTTDRDLRNQGAYNLFGGPLNSRRASVGLAPVEKIFDYGFTEEPLLAADAVLAPAPPDVATVQTGAWISPDERPLSEELEAFLNAGPPPVYVSFGSGPAPTDVATVAIEAVRAQGYRVVLARGWAGLALPDDRGDCLAVGEVNHQALFGRVAAVVHHGGAGTTTVATRAGVPQVVVPQKADQPYFAGRVAELGVGVAHDGPAPTFDSLSAALATALSPETRARASAVAGTIRVDGTSVAADLLFEAVSRNKPAVSA